MKAIHYYETNKAKIMVSSTNRYNNSMSNGICTRKVKLPLVVVLLLPIIIILQIIHHSLWLQSGCYNDEYEKHYRLDKLHNHREEETTNRRESSLEACPSEVDTTPTREGLVCFTKCTPLTSNKLNLQETINISMPVIPSFGIGQFFKYKVHFPEEDVWLNLTTKLSNDIDIAVDKARNDNQSFINDEGFLQPRSITERLMRRIVAKLLKAGVLDPTRSIVNTGSWIGDNALPWATMLVRLSPDNHGQVIAIDPSESFVKDMIELANYNRIGNLCVQTSVLSSKASRVMARGKSTDHVGVLSEQQFDNLKAMRKNRLLHLGSWLNAIPLDSISNLPNISLIHLDVEGHEGEVLEGARFTINNNRPIIITEGYDEWPNPIDDNDKKVYDILTTELGYKHASTINELCGLKSNARNRIWFPDDETYEKAMSVVGKDLGRTQIVPWMARDLPEV